VLRLAVGKHDRLAQVPAAAPAVLTVTVQDHELGTAADG
jgi:hypothetical protein